MTTFDIALLEKTVNRLSTQPGVDGLLIMNANGVVLRTTLQPELATQASALAQAVTTAARTAVRELNLVNFGAQPQEARSKDVAPPTRREPGSQSNLTICHIWQNHRSMSSWYNKK